MLRDALARRHNVPRDNIVLGVGIDDLLGLVVRAFCDPGDHVVMSHGAYPTFAFHVRGFGAKLVTPALSRRPQRSRGARRGGAPAQGATCLSFEPRQSHRELGCGVGD